MVKVLRRVLLVYFSIYLVPTIFICTADTIRYISTEHPSVTYFNPKYMSYINLTSQRYGRTSPVYYIALHMITLTTVGNNLTVDFYFYEYLSNVYKRGFIEMHFKWCDLVHKDKFFGTSMRQGKLAEPCPYPPGEYHLYNMSISSDKIPASFPFKKGRIYANVTVPATKEIWAEAYVDIELKEFDPKKHSRKGFRGLL